MRVVRRQQEDVRTAFRVPDGMAFGVPAAFGDDDTMRQAPFLTSAGAVALDATGVDEYLFRHTVHPGKLSENPLPHTAFGPAQELVAARLLRTVDMFRTVAPATATLQSMSDPR